MGYRLLYRMWLALLQVASSTMIPHVTPITPWAPQQYNFTLGTDPRDVWRPIVKDHRKALDVFLTRFDYLHLPDVLFWALEYWGTNWCGHQDFIGEIKALAEVAEVRWGKLLFLNFMY
jgi:hypothetical protein